MSVGWQAHPTALLFSFRQPETLFYDLSHCFFITIAVKNGYLIDTQGKSNVSKNFSAC
ncbi:MAG: hypothetical protein IKX14_08705 [Neisseriaceae bacterium]|nr:hypothetical protein [Neisseriaceae bacterium]